MMIRSTPPASAHLADSPVPAPAPMITPPPSSVARSSRAPRRPSSRSPSRRRPACSTIASANASVVDVLPSSSTSSTLSPSPSRSAANSAASASGSWNGCALDVDHRDAPERHEQRDRPGRGRQLARDPPAELRVLLRRRAHQRDRRVVHVEVAALELRRHRVARAEVDHVERAERDDLREPGARPRPRAGRARRRARRRRGRRTARSSSRRARRRGSPPRRAPPSPGRPCPWRGRRAPRSRAPRAPRAPASRTAS